MAKKKTRKASPFGKGSNWNLNACVGTNGGPYDYAAYGSGYFNVGHHLAKHIVATNAASGEVILDIAIYPLLYLYRQGCELMVKHFLFDKKNVPLKYRKNGVATLDTGHDIRQLWIKVRPEIKKLFEKEYGTKQVEEGLDKIEDFVLKMHALDPTGEVTRFPEDIYRKKFLQEYSVLNVEPIHISAMGASEAFDAFVEAREEMGEHSNED